MSQSFPGTGLSLTALEVVRLQSIRHTAYRQETQVATVVDAVGDTVDAVTIEDQVCIARQDYVTEATYHIPIEPCSIAPPRRGHSVTYFQVGRACSCDIAELQLAVEPSTSPATNNVWLAVYESDDVNFLVNRQLVGTLTSRQADRINLSQFTLAVFIGIQDGIPMLPGHHYWLAICSSQPGVTPVVRWCPDAADRPRLWTKKQSGVVSASTLLINDNDGAGGIDQAYPTPTSTYTSYWTEHVWFRLYERKHTLESVLLAEGSAAPSIGELTIIRRNAGLHSQPEVLGPVTGQTAGGIGRPAGATTVVVTGAPAGASYVLMSAYSGLANARSLLGTANQVIVGDGGAGGNVTLSGPQDIHTGASPTFINETLTGLSASRLMATDGAKAHASVAALSAWVAGTANRVTVADDGDGTITLSGPQDIHTAAGPTFDHIHLSALSAGRVPYVAAAGELVDNAGLTWGTAAGLISTIWKNTPLTGLRTTDVANEYNAAAVFRYQTSAAMVDGFGPAVNFQAQDDSSGVLNYGQFAFYRDGADNTSKFLLRVWNAGAAASVLTITALGVASFLGGVSAASLTASDLTNTRVVYAGAAGLLSDDAHMTWTAGTDTFYALNIAAGQYVMTGLILGSVVFGGAAGVVSQDNANFFWDDASNRLGIGNNAPAYPLDVTGQVRITTNLGIGVTPVGNRAINAFYSQVAAASDAVGGYLIGQNDYAAGAQSGTVYGFLSEAKQNQATILATAMGYQGGVTISADDGTVTSAYGVRARFNLPASAVGHPRTLTTAYAFSINVALGANNVLGTLYGFHMPTCAGTTRWGVYIADAGANSYFAAQCQFASGVVGTPGQAFLAETTTGIYRPGANTWAVTIAGTERFRVGAGGIGIVGTNELFLDGVALGGNTTIRERAADVICLKAGGNDQYEVRADHMYGRPTTYAPVADGEFAFRTDKMAMAHMIGGTVHYNGCGLVAGPITAETATGTGAQIETAFATSATILGTLWEPGKAFEALAYVEASANGSAWRIEINLRLTASPAGLGGELIAGPTTLCGNVEGRYGNGILRGTVLCNTRAVGGTVTCLGEGTRITQGVTTEQMIAVGWDGVMYRDNGTEAVNTTIAQAFRVTYTVIGGDPGAWSITLKQLLLRSLN